MGTNSLDLTFIVDRVFPAVIGVLCLLGAPATTAALSGDLVDTIGDDDELVLAPADGPNGQYATIQNETQEVTINITEAGVNDEAVSDFERIFTITNQAEYPLDIRITDSANIPLDIYASPSEQDLSRTDGITVRPNETTAISLRIDTTGNAVQARDRLRFTLLINATALGDQDDDGIPDGADECPRQPGLEATTGCPAAEQVTESGTTLRFADPVQNETATAITITERSPGNRSIAGGIATREPDSEQIQEQLAARSADRYTVAGEPVTFQANVTRTAAINRTDRTVVKRVQITAPAAVADRDATVDLTVNRSALGTSDPASAQLARRVNGEWRPLSTTVVSAGPTTVTLRADTVTPTGDIAVLAANEIQYQWSSPETAQSQRGEQITIDDLEPGQYTVTLTASDSFGNTVTDSQVLIVNDEPTVQSPDVVTTDSTTRELTLQAVTADNVGGPLQIQFEFPTATLTGSRVTHTVPDGQDTVPVTIQATDSFGAETQVTESIPLPFDTGNDTTAEDSETTEPESDNESTPESGAESETPDDADVVEEGVAIDLTENESDASSAETESVNATDISVTEIQTPEPATSETGDIDADITASANESQATTQPTTISGEIDVDVSAGISPDLADVPDSNATPTELEVSDRVREQNASVLTQTEQDTRLVGNLRTTFGTTVDDDIQTVDSTDTVEGGREIVRQVEISVPAEQEDRPATLEFEATRAELGDTDPTEVQIGRRVNGQWQLLETEVIDESGETLTFQARTPGFSRFALFAENELSYRWEVESHDQSFQNQTISTSFEEPGRYNATFYVEDEFGRQATANTSILANDQPDVTIRTMNTDADNQTATLQADVDDEFGETQIVWVHPDGSTYTGDTVTFSFADTSPTVRVFVVDNYGAVGRAETDVSFGSQLVSFESGVPSSVQFIVGAWLVGFAAVIFRWRLVGLMGPLFVTHSPEITEFETPVAKLDRNEIRLPRLAVTDDLRDLERVDLSVETESGDILVEQSITLSGVDRFEATDQRLWLAPESHISRDTTYRLHVEAVDKTNSTAAAERAVQFAEPPS